jgi:hypothetical protein
VQYWEIPKDWAGQRAAIIASGPSLTAEQVDVVRRAGIKTVAVNDAYRMAPWADVLYFCDAQWWSWHKAALAGWQGEIVRLESPEHDFGDPRIKVLRNCGTDGFTEQRDGVMNGLGSGYQALHMVAHRGASEIYLLGFDCKTVNGKKHFFGEHPNRSNQPLEQWVIRFNGLASILKAKGVRVINCTPGSALTCFPMMDINDASLLPDPRRALVSA